MPCDNQVGVKNILITFHDCDTDGVIRNVSHKLSTNDLPEVRACAWTNTELTNGFTRREASNASINMNVIRDLRVPIAFYQGCASVDIQIEYLNGLVYTGIGGTVIGDQRSDTHDVPMEMIFRVVDEMLPAEQLQAA